MKPGRNKVARPRVSGSGRATRSKNPDGAHSTARLEDTFPSSGSSPEPAPGRWRRLYDVLPHRGRATEAA